MHNTYTSFSLAMLLATCCAAPVAAQTPPPELAQKNGCMGCHDMAKKLVGPGFAQVAARYKGDGQAPAQLAAKIRGGSQGTWGRISMPQHPQVSQDDALSLARWVLSQPIP